MVSVCIDYLPYRLFLEGSGIWKLGELMHIATGVLPITSKILSAELAQAPCKLQLE